MEKLVCIEDFEKAAYQVLDRNALGYYKSGADDEITLQDNKSAFKRWTILPRVLRDVSVRNLSRAVLGKEVSIPIGFSPTGSQKMAHEDGEIGNARVAESAGTIFILSIAANSSMEDVAKAAPRGRNWCQICIYTNRDITRSLVKRAEACGFEVLVLTMDVPVFGKRRADIRNKFKLPSHLRISNFESGAAELERFKGETNGGSVQSKPDALMDSSLTWTDFDWLRSITRLPVIAKGILSREDACLAVRHGAAAVLVSNHGGRQVDTVPATIDVLEGIVDEVRGRVDVFLDGGVRTGSDVFKALALGAKMVFAGRPFLWGLAVAGEDGSREVLNILKDELDLTMALSGLADINKIDRHYVARHSSL